MAADSKKVVPIKNKRRVVKGIEHGTVSSYTNHECRCEDCTEANREHSAQYRARRFAGEPLCRWGTWGKGKGKCNRKQSHSYGNSLCWMHARLLIRMRRVSPKAARRVEKFLGIQPSSSRKAA